MSCALHVWNLYTVFIDTNIEQDRTLNNSNFVYRVAWTACAYTQGTPGLWKYRTVIKHNFKLSTCVFLIFSLCPSRVIGFRRCVSCLDYIPPLPGQSPRAGLVEVPCHVRNSSSRPYLPVPISNVPSRVVNSSSRLPTCQVPSAMSHLLW